MDAPLATIITSTWQRHELLLDRCVPSVQAQDYPAVEHIIVSDGPDENLRDYFAHWKPPRHPVYFFQLPAHDPEPHYGWRARNRGLELAAGKLTGYCDDDDALRPEHCALMADALAILAARRLTTLMKLSCWIGIRIR